MQRRVVLAFAVVIAFFFCSAALSQPSMTLISPNYGGVGSNSPGTWTITGSGFSTAPKATRFVDTNNVDLFSYVSCESTTTCTAYSNWANRVPAGTIANLAIFALVNGTKSGSFAPFKYYGAPIVTSVNPSSAPSFGTSGITISGSGFTSGVNYPGMTSIYLQSNILDLVNGCASTTQCTNFTAPSLSVGVKTGPNTISLRTPGGDASPIFNYVPGIITPLITAVTPNHGSSQGGTAIVVSGANFSTAANAMTFTFTTPGNSTQAGSVVCPTTSSCSMTVPPGYGTATITAMTTNATSFSAASALNNASRFVYAGFTVAWTDGRTITSTGNVTLFTSENGGAAQYSLALNTAPAAPVTVALSVSNAGGVRGTIAPTSMTFSAANWSVPQYVAVYGVDDTGVGGAAPPGLGDYMVSATAVATSADSAFNGVSQQMNVANVDNDTAGLFYSRTAQLVTAKDGGTATVGIALRKAPASNVVLTFVSNHPFAGSVSPGTMTFTPAAWSAPKILTITGLADGMAGNVPYAILVTAATTDPAYAALGSPQDLFVTNGIAPPPSVTAIASSGASVAVAWPAVPGADAYEVFRSDGVGYARVGWTLTNTFADGTVAPYTAYMYRVRAIAADISSSESAGDFTVTTIYTDDPLVAGTFVKALHLTQIRTAVTSLRALGSLAPYPWTDFMPAGVPIRSAHITELRIAVNEARYALGGTLLFFTNTAAPGTPVRAIDFTELRNAVK